MVIQNTNNSKPNDVYWYLNTCVPFTEYWDHRPHVNDLVNFEVEAIIAALFAFYDQSYGKIHLSQLFIFMFVEIILTLISYNVNDINARSELKLVQPRLFLEGDWNRHMFFTLDIIIAESSYPESF